MSKRDEAERTSPLAGGAAATTVRLSGGGAQEKSHLASLHVAPEGGAELVQVASARAVAGRGLEGDRYFLGSGTWSKPGRWNEVTLVEEEALARASEALGRSVRAREARRNLVTRGVDLNGLVGRRFRIGAVTLVGERLCHPCAYLEKLAGAPGLKAALEGCGGLRASVVEGGVMKVGDGIDIGEDEMVEESGGEE